jgi:hypothetical protein
MMRCAAICSLLVVTSSLNAQKTTPVVDVKISPTYEKMTVTIKSEKELTSDYILNITNCEGKIIKSVQLQEKQLPKGNDVYIHDIALGKYCYSLLNGSKEITHGEFTTDIYDEL